MNSKKKIKDEKRKLMKYKGSIWMLFHWDLFCSTHSVPLKRSWHKHQLASFLSLSLSLVFNSYTFWPLIFFTSHCFPPLSSLSFNWGVFSFLLLSVLQFPDWANIDLAHGQQLLIQEEYAHTAHLTKGRARSGSTVWNTQKKW